MHQRLRLAIELRAVPSRPQWDPPPSGVHRKRVTAPRCPRRTTGSWPRLTFQTRTVPSRPAVATRVLLGLKATWSPGPCGRSLDRLTCPGGQSRPVPSSLPVATSFPSGLNATASTWPSWPRITFKGLPVFADQRRRVQSPWPVAITLPSGSRDRLDCAAWQELPAREGPSSGPEGSEFETRRDAAHRDASIAWLSTAPSDPSPRFWRPPGRATCSAGFYVDWCWPPTNARASVAALVAGIGALAERVDRNRRHRRQRQSATMRSRTDASADAQRRGAPGPAPRSRRQARTASPRTSWKISYRRAVPSAPRQAARSAPGRASRAPAAAAARRPTRTRRGRRRRGRSSSPTASRGKRKMSAATSCSSGQLLDSAVEIRADDCSAPPSAASVCAAQHVRSCPRSSSQIRSSTSWRYGASIRP